MRIAWIGFHFEGLDALRTVLESGTAIHAFITLAPDAAAKRSGNVSYADLCAKYGVPMYEVRNINDQDAVDLLRSLDLDLAFVIGWSQIVRDEARATTRLGMIGAHASLLPHNRGRAPINWALIRGETETGNTLMWLASGADEGDIIEQARFPITPYDTCETLYEKVAETNTSMIMNVLAALRKGPVLRLRQADSGEATLPKRTPEDGRIDWAADAFTVYNFIRALTHPYPGAFSVLSGSRCIIWRAAVLPLHDTLALPGTVLGPVFSPSADACGQLVACGRGAVLLLEIEDAHGTRSTGAALSDLPLQNEVFTHE